MNTFRLSKPSNLKKIQRSVLFISMHLQIQILKKFQFPAIVTKKCENAFYRCTNLTKFEIPTNSNLQIIDKNAFSESNVEKISIPTSVTKISDCAFCVELLIAEISEESKLESLSKSIFYNCEKIIIMVPSSLTKLIHSINSI